MNISGIRPTEGFYSYNSIKVNELRSQQILANHKTESHKQEESVADEQVRNQQTFTSLDYAKKYQPDEVFSLKGAESDIHKLDIEKAKSDLDKDHILQQYQYFVGTNKENENKQPKAIKTRMGENFML